MRLRVNPRIAGNDQSLTYNGITMRREEVDLSPVDVLPVRSSQRKDAVA
jgi:hypothetical protein